MVSSKNKLRGKNENNRDKDEHILIHAQKCKAKLADSTDSD